jgi:hypothetical protein
MGDIKPERYLGKLLEKVFSINFFNFDVVVILEELLEML